MTHLKFYKIEDELSGVNTTPGVVCVDETTRTFEFPVKPPAAPDIDPAVTLADLRELRAVGLNNVVYFAKAKRMYAGGGTAKEIQKVCGFSHSTARKVVTCFNRAKRAQCQKTGMKNSNL